MPRGVRCRRELRPARARGWLATAAAERAEADQIRTFSALNLAYHKRLKNWRRYGAVWEGRIARCETQALRLLAVTPHVTPARAKAPSAATTLPAPRAAEQPLQHPLLAWLASLLLNLPQPAKA